MIQAVIFDVGSVLVEPMYRPGVRKLAEALGMEANELMHAIKDEFSGPVMCGRMLESEHFANVCQKYGYDTDAGLALLNCCGQTPPPLPDSWKIVEELFAKQLTLGILSDMGKEWTSNLRRTLPFDQYFPVQVFSYGRGYRKPDRQIYEYLLRALNRAPEEVMFIDDKEENIAAAQALGMHGHVFTDASGLRVVLTELGVL